MKKLIAYLIILWFCAAVVQWMLLWKDISQKMNLGILIRTTI